MEVACRKRKLDRTVIQKLYNDVPSKDPSRINFLKRLKTFDIFNWSGKPIDPPMCAKHGWEIAEIDVLKCLVCQQFLSVSLPSRSNYVAYKEACSKLVQKLTAAHSKYCIYARNPLPDSVTELEHTTTAELQDRIQEQLLSFRNIEASCKLPKSQEEVKDLFDWFLAKHTLPDVHLSSFVLVLTGWELLKNDMLLVCDYCNRKWSLEPYLSQQTPADKSDSERLAVDPVAQHQSWCAWRTERRGWESHLLQLQNLKESHNSEKRSRLQSEDYATLTEGMRKVRRLLNGSF